MLRGVVLTRARRSGPRVPRCKARAALLIVAHTRTIVLPIASWPRTIAVVPLVVVVIPLIIALTALIRARLKLLTSPEISIIEAVAHTSIIVRTSVAHACSFIALRATAVPRLPPVVVPRVTAAIGIPEGRAPEIEIITMGIARIHSEVPKAVEPIDRAIEVSCLEEILVLPIEKDIAQVEVAPSPIVAIEVCFRGDTHKIVEVNLVACLILLLSKVHLIRHFVGEEESLLASLLEAHCLRCFCQKEQRAKH